MRPLSRKITRRYRSCRQTRIRKRYTTRRATRPRSRCPRFRKQVARSAQPASLSYNYKAERSHHLAKESRISAAYRQSCTCSAAVLANLERTRTTAILPPPSTTRMRLSQLTPTAVRTQGFNPETLTLPRTAPAELPPSPPLQLTSSVRRLPLRPNSRERVTTCATAITTVERTYMAEQQRPRSRRKPDCEITSKSRITLAATSLLLRSWYLWEFVSPVPCFLLVLSSHLLSLVLPPTHSASRLRSQKRGRNCQVLCAE